MSYDSKIQNKCDHRVLWEQSTLGTDLKTIPLTRPVAAVSSVALRINNVVVETNQYSVSTVRGSLSLTLTSSILMRYIVKDWQPLVEVNYITYANNCPKCVGINTVDDIVYTASGDFKMVSKEYLLLQTVEKAIITKVTTNPFHDWYGTGLHSLIGSKITDMSFLRTKIIDQISNAIEKVKTVQKQYVSANRKVDPGELFGQLLSLTVDPTEDPTMVAVAVVFTAQSGQTLEYSQLIDLTTARERVAFS